MIKSPLSPDELRALPASVDIVTAGRALGIGRTKSYELARRREFPVPVLPVGNDKYRVARGALLRALHVEDAGDGTADTRPAA